MNVSIQELYTFAFPYIDEETTNLSFTVQLPDSVLTIALKWLDKRWLAWVTLPSGEIRKAVVLANILHWSLFQDYGIAFAYPSKTAILQQDINSVNVMFFKWGPV